MEPNHHNLPCLDLTHERCPMALLLAKRKAEILSSNQSLKILSNDLASTNDMLRYFNQSPYSVELFAKEKTEDQEFTLIVTKKE
ncbi:MAG: sulfurtransferase TusA family protein [Vibrio sp.]